VINTGRPAWKSNCRIMTIKPRVRSDTIYTSDFRRPFHFFSFVQAVPRHLMEQVSQWKSCARRLAWECGTTANATVASSTSSPFMPGRVTGSVIHGWKLYRVWKIFPSRMPIFKRCGHMDYIFLFDHDWWIVRCWVISMASKNVDSTP
jgi:hypothetical protein